MTSAPHLRARFAYRSLCVLTLVALMLTINPSLSYSQQFPAAHRPASLQMGRSMAGYRLYEVSGNIPSQGWGEPMPMQPTSATFSSQSGHGYLRHAYTLPVSAMSLGSGVSAEEALSTASQYRRVGPRRALGDGDEDEGPGFNPANPGDNSSTDPTPIGSPILPLLLLTIVYAVSKWRIQKSAKND